MISNFYSNVNAQKPHMVFVGRFAPLHKGHTWIIEQKRKECPDKPVLILVRATSFDEFSANDRARLVENWMKHNNIDGTVMIIPDIEGIYYGRGVGYNVDELKPPDNIKVISATEIRNRIKKKDELWKNLVAPGTSEFLEKIINEST